MSFASRARVIPIACLALTFAVALIFPGAADARLRTVAVSGSASRLVANDTAHLSASVSKERPTAEEALSATAQRLRFVLKRVRAAGRVAPADVDIHAISVHRVVHRGPEGGRRVAYRATQGADFTLHKVKRAGPAVAAAVAAGATDVFGPTFSLSDPDSHYDAVLAASFDRARRKARALADRAGMRLGGVVSISESGGVRPTPVAYVPSSGGDAGGGEEGAPPPVRPGRSTVQASVRVVFELR